jgi:hypothetical protein
VSEEETQNLHPLSWQLSRKPITSITDSDLTCVLLPFLSDSACFHLRSSATGCGSNLKKRETFEINIKSPSILSTQALAHV